MKKIFLPFLLLLFVSMSAVVARTEAPPLESKPNGKVLDISKDIAKIRQNLRPFDTLSLVVATEKPDSEGKWVVTRRKRVLWDITANRLKQTVVEMAADKFGRYHCIESVFANGKTMGVHSHVSSQERDVLNPKKRVLEYGYLNRAIEHTRFYARLDVVYFFYAKPPQMVDLGGGTGVWFYQIFGEMNPSEIKFISAENSQGDMRFLFNDHTLSFDKRTGALKRLVWESLMGQDKEDFLVTEFSQKNGWIFPVTIEGRTDGKAGYRQRIEPSSLEINKNLTPEDFRVVIPAGSQVVDRLKDETYVTGKDLTTSEIWSPDENLKSLFPKKEVEKAVEKTLEKAIDAKPETKKGGAK